MLMPLSLIAAAILFLTSSASAAPSEEADIRGILPGIAVFGPERVTYARSGEDLRLAFGGPVVVAEAPGPMAWGYFQFPEISCLEDGSLLVEWHMAPDSATAYGSERGRAVSRDGGRTWAPAGEGVQPAGLLLPNGDRIAVVTPPSRKASDLALPEPAGTIGHGYGGVVQTMYRLGALPADLRGVPMRRKPRGASAWAEERAELDDPLALRYQIQGVFPVIWWGDLCVAPDGSVVAGIYPGYRLREDGSVDPKGGAFFYRSTDNGRRWSILGRIPYRPEPGADPKAQRRGGFTEPATVVLGDGSLLCVLRATDGAGFGPMYAARSTDLGATWTAPRAIAPSGVLPRLLRLGSGVTVLSAGRPGVQLRFSTDGAGARWTQPFEMLPHGDDAYAASCGYTGLLATGPDRFLLVYSDFRHPTAAGPRRKAILVREITVTPRR